MPCVHDGAPQCQGWRERASRKSQGLDRDDKVGTSTAHSAQRTIGAGPTREPREHQLRSRRYGLAFTAAGPAPGPHPPARTQVRTLVRKTLRAVDGLEKRASPPAKGAFCRIHVRRASFVVERDIAQKAIEQMRGRS